MADAAFSSPAPAPPVHHPHSSLPAASTPAQPRARPKPKPAPTNNNPLIRRFRIMIGTQTLIFLFVLIILGFSASIMIHTSSGIYRNILAVPLTVTAAYMVCSVVTARTTPINGAVMRPRKRFLYVQAAFFWPWLAVAVLTIWAVKLLAEDKHVENISTFPGIYVNLRLDIDAINYSSRRHMKTQLAVVAALSLAVAITTFVQLVAIHEMQTYDVPFYQKAEAYTFIVGAKRVAAERAAEARDETAV